MSTSTEHLPNPINVEDFEPYFREIRDEHLQGMILTAFRQTEFYWWATYQDSEIAVTFSGRIDKLRKLLGDWQKARAKALVDGVAL